MKHEQQVTEFSRRLQDSARDNLASLVVYGSVAAEEFHSGFSDVNLLCVLRRISEPLLRDLSPAVIWWTKQGHPAPLIFSSEELSRSARVFPIEMLDIKENHRVLVGDDPFVHLEIPMDLHRVQLEHELRTRLLHLRQQYAAIAADSKKIDQLLLRSISAISTLFRHALITLAAKAPASKADVMREVGQRVSFDASPFQKILAIREAKSGVGKLPLGKNESYATFTAYLDAMDRVVKKITGL